MNDVGIMEYINTQIDICKTINAEIGTLSFEKEDWKITITVKRKQL